MVRKILSVLLGLAFLAFFAWVLHAPRLDIGNEEEVREWTSYSLSQGLDPLRLQSLDRVGDHYTGEAVARDGRVFQLRIEGDGNDAHVEAGWQGPNGWVSRVVGVGPPPIEVRHPWVEWLAIAVLFGTLCVPLGCLRKEPNRQQSPGEIQHA